MLTNLLSRRRMLSTAAHGFGAAALACLLQEELVAADPPNQEHHLRPKSGHHAARAKRALFLWMSGGPSQVDTFDPKPKLLELHGQDIPIQLPPHLRDAGKRIVASPFKFSQHGEAGLPISEIFPQLAQHADDLCVVRSMKCDNIDHVSATMQLFSGEQMSSRPSLGAWLMYGLGTENHNLPGFFVISPGKDAFVHPAMIGTSFLPAIHEGTPIRDLDRPLANIKHPELSLADQRLNLDVLRELNQLQQEHRPEDSRLEARIASFETAFRMQVAAPDALDVSQESQAAHRLYGLDDKLTNQFGTECLMARRLLERGVRFVHVNHYSKAQGQDRWDQHGDLEKGIAPMPPRSTAPSQDF